MNKIVFILALLVPAQSFALLGPDNYWECIIDRESEATTDQEANAIRRGCRIDFPDYYWRVSIPKQDGILEPSTQRCIEKETKNITVKRAQELIVEACQALYFVK